MCRSDRFIFACPSSYVLFICEADDADTRLCDHIPSYLPSVQTVSQLVNQSVSQLVRQTVSHSVSQSANQSFRQSVNQSVNQLHHQSNRQSVNKVYQWVSKQVRQSVNPFQSGLTLKTSALKNSSQWQIHIINSVDKTKLSCYPPPS